MPLRSTIDRPNRLVVVVGRGEVSLADLARLAQDVIRERMVTFAILLDLAGAEPAFTSRELQAVMQVLKGNCHAGEPGSVAVVTETSSELFRALSPKSEADADLPLLAFQSLRDARYWLTSTQPHHGWKPARRMPGES